LTITRTQYRNIGSSATLNMRDKLDKVRCRPLILCAESQIVTRNNIVGQQGITLSYFADVGADINNNYTTNIFLFFYNNLLFS
jgi:hypothetical protein